MPSPEQIKDKLTRLPFDPWTIALYGITHTGKSSQCALLAKYIADNGGLKTRWYLFDDGDTPAEVDKGVNAGYIEVIDCRGVPHPFLSAMQIAKGKIPVLNGLVDEKTDIAKGSWVVAPLNDIGLVVIDSGTGLADDMFQDLSAKSALGINIGGEGALNFKDGSTGWGDLSVGSSNRAHYGIVQSRMQDIIGRIKQLASREGCMVAMTFAEDQGDVESTKVQIIGPKSKGSAQTALIPGWFKFTYRMVTIPTAANKEPDHVLWTERHRDGGKDALANRRFPVLDSVKDRELLAKHPPMIKPASLVQALRSYQEVIKGG